MKRILLAGIVAFMLPGFSTSASAVTENILVGNFSFEDPKPPTPPGYDEVGVSVGSILDWTFSTSHSDYGGGVETYASSPDVTSLGDGNGLNFAYLNVDGTGSITYNGTGTPTEGGTGSDVAVALPDIVAGASYTLSVGLDNRAGTSGTGGDSVSLIAGGTDFFTTTVPFASLPTNTFAIESVTLTAAETEALGGETLGIQISESSPNGFSQLDADNVTLTETIPEPGTWALMGVGSLGMLFLAKHLRRKSGLLD